ncbi:pyrroline-5-carboxylate reductase [Hymenobacter roseosalivarius DSM 11622]|uniref:Pyrroline-5-carboxylate reductase n=1 Tax=Hymenobacter roseosalivarius DSM 11622 TaxID=645990 RepID=A0A1W1W3K6_9BACT|nr:pyrroline-5-carboxylate reductase [Hymenobacter roseosalivarius]SMC00212.1 pyrroline-5-carboxylate reductase [Hymenobacter roseosalivarius DSM 11622]
MNKNLRIAILGCGNMGQAFAKAFLQYNLVARTDMLLLGRDDAHCQRLNASQLGMPTGLLSAAIGSYDVVLVAVKPQDFGRVADGLRQVLQPEQVVVSIMAGIPISRLQRELDHRQVLRAMPNTPALLGMGITGFSAAPEVGRSRLHQVENLLNATGRSIFMEDESLLDAVTAVSGSGPAYFYYIVQAMMRAGQELGFSESVAGLLVKQTMLGAFHLLNNSDQSIDQLIANVASKGGTTEAALRAFRAGNLAETLVDGIKAAQQRATELAKE